MARELSAMLDHVAKIGELDLDGVAADLARRRGHRRACARTSRAPCLPRELALAQAPAMRATRASSSPARRRERRAASSSPPRRPPPRSPPASSRPAELFDAYRERAAADRAAGEGGLNCFTWVAEERARRATAARSRGVPLAVKDLFCTEGVPSQSGSKILEGYRPPYTATVVERLQGAGAPLLAKTNQDEFAMGSSTENSAYGPVRNPWDRDPRPRRLLRRQRRRRRRRARAVGARHRHRRLDPPAGGAVRDRRPETDLRRGLALRDDRLRLLAGPGRAADPRRHATPRCCSAQMVGQRPVRRDLAAAARAGSRCRAPSASTACASACPAS